MARNLPTDQWHGSGIFLSRQTTLVVENNSHSFCAAGMACFLGFHFALLVFGRFSFFAPLLSRSFFRPDSIISFQHEHLPGNHQAC